MYEDINILKHTQLKYTRHWILLRSCVIKMQNSNNAVKASSLYWSITDVMQYQKSVTLEYYELYNSTDFPYKSVLSCPPPQKLNACLTKLSSNVTHLGAFNSVIVCTIIMCHNFQF